jgi:non-specific serine/threonine protein kinase
LVVLCKQLRTGRLLTLTGPGGCGKTRLALRLAADAAGDYAAGACWVELASVNDSSVVPRAVATACGVREEAGRPLLATLVDVLRPKRLLLVLDNCEHLLDACARLADALLRACPELTVVATSREALGVAGETPWRVPPLAAPPFGPPPGAEALVDYEAVRLFAERAVAVQPAFAVTAHNASAVAQLCRRLDGLPLALELAAARLRALTVEQVLDRLDDRFRLLTGGSRTALPHQQTLRATVDWSHALLSEPEQRLFAHLAVFAGGWDLEAAEAVGGGATSGADGVLDGLMQLVDKSLVVATAPSDGAARYHLLETLRQYARERLETGGQAAAARERHAAYYLALAERGPVADWLDRMERAGENLRAALRWWTERGDGEHGLRLAVCMAGLWYARGHFTEGRHWFRALLELPEAGASPSTRARALTEASTLARRQGDLAAARARAEQAVPIWRRTGDRDGLARALDRLALVAVDEGAPDEARPLLEESLALFRETGNRRGIGRTLDRLGVVAHAAGDLPTARARYEESIALHRADGDDQITGPLHNLGALLLDQDDVPAARARARECLESQRASMGRLGIAGSLDLLAGVAAAEGRAHRAFRLAGASAALREAMDVTLAPAVEARLHRWLDSARHALTTQAHARAQAEGQAMPLEQAVAYALEESPDVA